MDPLLRVCTLAERVGRQKGAREMEAVLEEPVILLCEKKIGSLKDLIPLLPRWSLTEVPEPKAEATHAPEMPVELHKRRASPCPSS
jgi:hypothetical protein